MSLQVRIEELATRIGTEFKTVRNSASGNTSGDLSGLSTTVKTSLLAAINELFDSIGTKQADLGFTPENANNKGNANGYASLDGTGKVPAAQLPSYVDDVLEYANLAAFPGAGDTGIIYVAADTNLVYRWTGSAYVVMSSSLALGETSATAYRGDRGKIGYDHALATGNQHSMTFAQLNSKPTTIAGYSITDAYTKTDIGLPNTDYVPVFEAALL